MSDLTWAAVLGDLIEDGEIDDPAEVYREWTGEPRHPESTRHTLEAS